jgi:hypothetical protein
MNKLIVSIIAILMANFCLLHTAYAEINEFVGVSAAPDDPSVMISLNKSQYVPGDNMKVTLTTSLGTGDNSWDIYVGLMLPDNSFYLMTFEPSFSLTLDLVPACPLKSITAESMTILDITLSKGLPTGNWQWASALGKDNFSKISEISLAPFTLSNPQGGELDLVGMKWTPSQGQFSPKLRCASFCRLTE